MEPLVSIVTPVYNGEEYLVECVESVLTQSHANWEYTIVDNCSVDRTVEIAEGYAAKDSRIRVVVNREPIAAIANHNAALRQISPLSKYCKVVFADDWIFPECLEKMVALAEKNPSVGMVGAYCLHDDRVTCVGLPYSTNVESGRVICRRHLLEKLYLFGSANSLLYRADLVRSRAPFYNEANIHADTEVCFALLQDCDFGFVHQVLTFTRVRRESLTTLSENMQTDYGGTLEVLRKYGPSYLDSDELRVQLERHLSRYYRYLAKSLVKHRTEEFWRYHKAQLVDSGLGFSRGRLIKAMFASICEAAVNPIDTLRRIYVKVHRGSQPASPRRADHRTGLWS